MTAAAAAAPQQQIVPLLPQLRAFARSLCGGDAALADDLVQDTVVLALRAWSQFDPETNLRSWLLKILHNRFHSLKRRKHLTAEIARDDLEGLSWAPASQEKSLELAAFKRAFKTLSPQHREVLVLVAVHGLPYEEVARIVGCELGTVKSRTNRARTLLKEILLGEGGPAKAGTAAANGAARAKPRRPRRAPARPTPAAAPPAAPAAPPAAVIVPAGPPSWLAEAEQRIIRVEIQLTQYRAIAARLLRAGLSADSAEALRSSAEHHLAALHRYRQKLLDLGAPVLSAA
jgi:RNA polymerase sigma-70 factor, ECF subfamily